MIQIGRFIVVGVSVVIFNLFLLYILTEIIGLWYLISSVFAYILAVILNFILQKFWVFLDRTSGYVGKQFLAYAIVSIGYLFLNTVFMYLLVDRLEFAYLFSQALITLVLASLNYLINKRFIFKTNSDHSYE